MGKIAILSCLLAVSAFVIVHAGEFDETFKLFVERHVNDPEQKKRLKENSGALKACLVNLAQVRRDSIIDTVSAATPAFLECKDRVKDIKDEKKFVEIVEKCTNEKTEEFKKRPNIDQKDVEIFQETVKCIVNVLKPVF